MSEELPNLDLSGFVLTQPKSKPYRLFDPQADGEYERLAQLVRLSEIEKLALKEGQELIRTRRLESIRRTGALGAHL